MENITFNMSTLHLFGSAFYEFLELRKRFFVDQLRWDIPHDDTVEMDQYDNPLAHYSLVLRNGQVIGGARAMSTKSAWGDHTYMLGDAVDGKLAGDQRRRDRAFRCHHIHLRIRTHRQRGAAPGGGRGALR